MRIVICAECGARCRVFSKEDDWVAICQGCGKVYGIGRAARDFLVKYAKDNDVKVLWDKLGEQH